MVVVGISYLYSVVSVKDAVIGLEHMSVVPRSEHSPITTTRWAHLRRLVDGRPSFSPRLRISAISRTKARLRDTPHHSRPWSARDLVAALVGDLPPACRYGRRFTSSADFVFLFVVVGRNAGFVSYGDGISINIFVDRYVDVGTVAASAPVELLTCLSQTRWYRPFSPMSPIYKDMAGACAPPQART